jgi:Zn-dependent protease with chaperone function
VRYIRIPVLVASVYGLGYQQGIIEYARNPDEVKEALLESVLADVGCTDPKLVHAVTDGLATFGTNENRSARRVARIGSKIKLAARELSRQKQQAAINEVKSKLPQDVTEEQLFQVLQLDEEFVMWTTAIEKLEGNWTYMQLDVDLPNAFVTEIVPRHVFITTAMLGMIGNDDELALVLGHELSHMILGHISERNMLETILRTVEVLLLSMDPTSGLLSLGVIGSLATLRTAFTAAHSRDHENQADTMGIQLAAMACFDTLKASEVFRKMHEQHIGAPNEHKLLSFADSHPTSGERYENLIQLSKTQNVTAYTDTTCASVTSRLKSALNQVT